MGRFVFKLPDVGEGTAEAELVAWHIAVGDMVEEDQLIAEVMTDKATVELTSPVAGVVSALMGEPGKTVVVGAPLVMFNVAGAGNVKPGAAPAASAPAPAAATKAEAKPAPAAASPTPSSARSSRSASAR